MKLLAWASRPDLLRLLGLLPHELYILDLHDIAAARRQRFDCIVFKNEGEYLDAQYELLSPAQRRLPKLFLESDPPRQHPVDSRHAVTDAGVLVVHLSAWNRLMWDHGGLPTRLIEPGLPDRGPLWSGSRARALALATSCGRRWGSDVLEQAHARLPLDVAPALDLDYRVLFHPARHAALPLEVLEAMMAGMPVAALRTGAIADVIRDSENGLLDADPDRLIARTRALLDNPAEAARLGANARRTALERFGLQRFVADWDQLLQQVTGKQLRKAA